MNTPNPVIASLLLAVALVAEGPGALAAPTILAVRGAPAELPAFGRFEAQIEVAAAYDNPFDPAQVAVTAQVVGPLPAPLVLTAFYYQDFRRELVAGAEVLTPVGPPHWRLRFAPTVPGEYHLTVRAADATGSAEADGGTFTVGPAASPGFVALSARNPRYLAFQDGSPYVPIGINVDWPDARGSFAYDHYFAKLQAVGGNWTRIWMTHFPPGLNLDWHADPYDPRYDLEAAWRLDEILRRAEDAGVYVQLCLQQHSQFEAENWSSWAENPWNAVNGGPLTTSLEFFTHPVTNALFARKLGYVAARYGAFRSILAWELWNEVDGILGYDPGVVDPWLAEKAVQLRALDVHGHLITNSYTFPPALAATPRDWTGMDLRQVHAYFFDPVKVLAQSAERLGDVGAPVIVAEYGLDIFGNLNARDPTGVNLHQTTWAALALGYAGGAMTWWWDSYVDPNDLYERLHVPAQFSADARWLTLTGPLGAATLEPADVRLEVYGQRGPDFAIAWVRDTRGDWDGRPRAELAPWDNLTLRVPRLTPGDWLPEFVDPWTGETTPGAPVATGGDGALAVPLPSFRSDLALKLARAVAPPPEPEPGAEPVADVAESAPSDVAEVAPLPDAADTVLGDIGRDVVAEPAHPGRGRAGCAAGSLASPSAFWTLLLFGVAAVTRRRRAL